MKENVNVAGNEKPVKNNPANFKPRIIYGSLILLTVALFFILRVFVSDYLFDLLIGFMMVLGAFEIENLMRKMNRPTFSVAVGIFPVLTFIVNVICAHTGMSFVSFLLINLILLILSIILWFAIPLLFYKTIKKSMLKDKFIGSPVYYTFIKSLNSAFVCIWPTLLLSFAFLINHFTDIQIANDSYLIAYQANADVGLLGLVLLFATTMFADTFAMLIGLAIKTPKISLKRLGPGKSWGGLVAGIIGAMVAALIVFVIFDSIESYHLLFNAVNLNIWIFMLGGLFCGLLSMSGDIFSSFFKRKAEVKDFSNLIPGHGGIMDRINGLLVNSLAVFILLCAFFV